MLGAAGPIYVLGPVCWPVGLVRVEAVPEDLYVVICQHEEPEARRYEAHDVAAAKLYVGEAIEPAPGGSDLPLVGRVAAKGLSDELRGAFYAVLETPAGMGYHVPLDRASAEALRVGDFVSFSTKPSDAGSDGPARHRLVLRKDDSNHS